jgi:hypothetical protein
MNDRRRALIALLDQYPLERDLYLHDGRRDVSPRDEFAGKIEALFMPESSASITTPEGQRDYYRDLMTFERDENIRLTRDLAEYEAYDAMPSLFQRVMSASETYVKRFGGELSLEGAMEKMHEEWDELHVEIANYEKFQHPIIRSQAAKEAIDLLVTVGGVLSALGVSIEITISAANATLDKLDERTTDKYAWNGKTVEKIGKVKTS